MDERTDPHDESYDVVVVGSGLGGISAAALLAKAGKKVLVVERLDGPGGYAHAFRRGPYTFDPAIHAIAQGKEGGRLDIILRHLGVRDQCDLIPIHPFYAALFPDFRIDAPHGTEAYVEAHVERFPQEEQGIRDFYRLCLQAFIELDMLEAQQAAPKGLMFKDLEEDVATFPVLFQYRLATVAEVMDQFMTDPHLKAALSTLWAYQGVPPSQLAFLPWAGMMISLLEGGQFYAGGSFQSLVGAFVAALEQNGGELVVRNRVTRIVVEDGRATGVILENGRRVQAPTIVSNADARQTFMDLVGPDHLPAPFMRRLNRMQPSVSAFLVYAVTSMDMSQVGAVHEKFVYNYWDQDEVYQAWLRGMPAGITICVPTLTDPSVAPPGEHIVTSVMFTAYDVGKPWDEMRESLADAIIDELDALYPGFRSHLLFSESSTPRALERYSLNYQGATYGWANTPQQTGSKRLHHQTPIPGLFLSSHWSEPGTGSIRVVYSGVQTAQAVLGYGNVRDYIPALAPDRLLERMTMPRI